MAVLRVLASLKWLLLCGIAAGLGLSGLVKALLRGLPRGVNWPELILLALGGHLMMIAWAILARQRAQAGEPTGEIKVDLTIMVTVYAASAIVFSIFD